MRTIILFIGVLMATSLFAQTPVQTIKGTVVDRANKQPLIGATVEVLHLEPTRGTVTDIDGQFELRDIPVGRRNIRVTYLGYEAWETNNAVLTTGRELILEIELREAAYEAGEIIVTAYQRDNAPINDASIVSTRSFSVEETQRYAASVNDPGRLAVGFPGVQPQRDTRTDIFIRGNSASGMIWRLEGIDIPNPNHFARIGSSGGGISIFSASLLANSDFSSGAFPAEYGNAYSGIFDMRFRKGNMQNREYTFRAGILGLDLAAEGPINKGKSSYLVNYRYSTLGILNEMGLYLVGPRTSNTFQDLSFALNFSGTNQKNYFTLWGIGGLSRETERVLDNRDAWERYTDYQTYDFDTDMGAIGLSHTWLINNKSYLTTSLAGMGQKIIYRIDTMNLADERFTVDDQSHVDSRITLASNYNYKFNPATSLKAGVQLSGIFYNFFRERFNFGVEKQEVITLGEGTTGLLQAYVQMNHRIGAKWNFNAGLRTMFFTLNNTYSIEPRAGIQFKPTVNQNISLAYGLHGMVLPMGSYFTRDPDMPDALPNKNLDIVQNHHLVLGYDITVSGGWKFGLELYYQHLTKVPVADDPQRTYWLLNEIQSFAREPLVSKGFGYNQGLDLTIEKFFDKGVFMILSGSVFSSEYEPLNGQRYSTQFNSRYAGTLMGGYEWQLENGNAIQFGLKTIYTAGLPITPLLDNPENQTDREPPLDETRPFSIQVPDYFRIDTRIAWRKNNPRTSFLLALDIQNVTSRKNVDIVRRQFDPDINQWVYVEMAGLTPLLSFQIDF